MHPEFETELEELSEALEECRPMLKLNPSELDKECREQPEKYEMIGQLATRAKFLSRKAKDAMEYVESDLRSKIRKDPEKFGLNGKITEGTVSETVEIQDELREAKSDYIELSRVADSFSVLVSSMEQRKAMLRDLVSLFVHKYYQGQSLSGEEKGLNDVFEEELANQRDEDIHEEDK